MHIHGEVTRFDRLVIGAILVNTAVLAWALFDHEHAEVLEEVDTCLLIFFGLELAIRIRFAGWRWLKEPWNAFDATVIMLALLPVVGGTVTVLRMARLARMVHLGRHISHLRVWRLLLPRCYYCGTATSWRARLSKDGVVYGRYQRAGMTVAACRHCGEKVYAAVMSEN